MIVHASATANGVYFLCSYSLSREVRLNSVLQSNLLKYAVDNSILQLTSVQQHPLVSAMSDTMDLF